MSIVDHHQVHTVLNMYGGFKFAVVGRPILGYDCAMGTIANMSVAKDCKFCRSNGILQGEVLAETDGAYMIKAGQFEQYYLIIPSSHTESLDALPNDWWAKVKTLLANIEGLEDYNLSINLGPTAGQTIKHIHFWVIPRSSDQLSSGKGLARLIEDAQI